MRALYIVDSTARRYYGAGSGEAPGKAARNVKYPSRSRPRRTVSARASRADTKKNAPAMRARRMLSGYMRERQITV